MKRLTSDAPEGNFQNALNLFYAKDGEAWVRGGGEAPEYPDVTLRDFIRKVIRTFLPEAKESLELNGEELDYMLSEWLFDGPEYMSGMVALLYTAGWAFAELRERLKKYEDSFEVSDGILADIGHVRELILAEKDGRLKIVKMAPKGECCGNCEDFFRNQGMASGKCRTQKRSRGIHKKEVRIVSQSTKACKEFRKKEK